MADSKSIEDQGFSGSSVTSDESRSAASGAVLVEDRDGVDGSAFYYGTREAFEQSGLIPEGLAFPGDMPGMKGARWYGLDRRRYTMCKWNRPAGTFRLDVRLSKEQEAQLRTRREHTVKLHQIDKELAAASIHEMEYRALAVRATLIGRHALGGGLQGAHGWTYEESVVDEINALFERIGEILLTGGVSRDLTEQRRLKAQRAALSDRGLQQFLCKVKK